MANDLDRARDKAAAEFTALQKELEQKAQAYRADRGKRADHDAAKLKLAIKAEEVGELARSAATLAGGKNHRPTPG